MQTADQVRSSQATREWRAAQYSRSYEPRGLLCLGTLVADTRTLLSRANPIAIRIAWPPDSPAFSEH